jgi:hypothetical protein
MADGDPIRIGRDNVASNPGAETILRRAANSPRTEPVFTVRTPVGGDGIHGEASGDRTGVQGTSASGTGVHGESEPSGIGVLGTSGALRQPVINIGDGVRGESQSSAGVRGVSEAGEGVLGEARRERAGVFGLSARGEGVFGRSTTNSGVSGLSDSGIGVDGSSISGAGVVGFSNSRQGVSGFSNSGAGVHGESPSSSAGVEGKHTGTTNVGFGVSGTSDRGAGVGGLGADFGVQGVSPTNFGVSGTTTSGIGVRGLSESATGVAGVSTTGRGVFGISTTNFGVSAISNPFLREGGIAGRDNYAVSGRGVMDSRDPTKVPSKAALFEGDVDIVPVRTFPPTGPPPTTPTGNLTVSGRKNFKIDHPLDPENRYLLHTCVESSEMKNVYDGVARLDEDGAAWVELPEWFEALNGDFRYQLTAVGGSAPDLHVAEELSENRFKIAGGQEGMKVCWQLTGSRKDPWAAANPLEVEQEKPEEERGRYLVPSLYGAPEEQSVLLGPRAEAVEGEPRPLEPSGIDFARLDEEELRLIDQLRRLAEAEEQRPEIEEVRRRREARQEEAPPEST